MRTASFIAGLLLVMVPMHYVGAKLIVIDAVFRDDPWPLVTGMLSSTRFVLPLWVYWAGFTVGGVCLIHLGIRRGGSFAG